MRVRIPAMRLVGAGVGCALGIALWLALAAQEASPLDSGKSLLGALLAAGFVVAVIEGELSWSGLGGLVLGQIGALSVLTSRGMTASTAPPLPLEMLFVLSYSLVAAVGGVAGAVVRGAFWRMPETGATPPRTYAPPDGR